MQITKAESYGIFGVIYLAEKAKDKITPLAEIATSQEVPEKFLAKIFQNLTKKGIVKSHRGVNGGFTLLKDPEKLTIREIVEAIQGPYHLISCLSDAKNCRKYDECVVRVVMEEAEKRLLEIFDSYTICDLIRWRKERLQSSLK
jgi:Rrf2 family protein